MTSTSIDTRKSDFFLSREAILLYIGKVTQERLASFHELGYVMREILPTPEGLQRLQEIRGNGALRRQLLLIFHDPEDLAARHNWLQFWRGMEQLKGITSILVSDRPGENIAEWGMQWRVQEVFHPSMANVDILKRVNQLIDFQDLVERKKNHSLPDTRYRVPLIKRIFDITVAGTALLMLSPILIIVMILIKLSSKGPVYYISKRVGTGYQVFDFYKFRSMRPNADQMVKDLMHLNQYGAEEATKEPEEAPMMISDDMSELDLEALIGDESMVSEQSYRNSRRNKAEKAFFKIEKDPRITKIGHIIRNSSIDELPQLINVLKGDMSIVGNRPLPLYEAEQLTTDEFTERFNAPAGITGLWQVTERGKKGVSGDSRKLLDVEYAQKYSVWLDFKILFMTLPAMFQKSDV